MSTRQRSYLTFVLCIIAPATFASSISRITLAELHSKSDLIVMGKVSKVVAKGNADTVTITSAISLKGGRPNNSYTFDLVTRGGLKDFDPVLKVGLSGIFFLKTDADGKVVKAYWGGIATFPKDHFTLK